MVVLLEGPRTVKDIRKRMRAYAVLFDRKPTLKVQRARFVFHGDPVCIPPCGFDPEWSRCPATLAGEYLTIDLGQEGTVTADPASIANLVLVLQ